MDSPHDGAGVYLFKHLCSCSSFKWTCKQVGSYCIGGALERDELKAFPPLYLLLSLQVTRHKAPAACCSPRPLIHIFEPGSSAPNLHEGVFSDEWCRDEDHFSFPVSLHFSHSVKQTLNHTFLHPISLSYFKYCSLFFAQPSCIPSSPHTISVPSTPDQALCDPDPVHRLHAVYTH